MSMQDPISDMLARIRNAGMAGRLEVAMPTSKMKQAIAEVLKNEGFILDCAEQSEGAKKSLVIKLKYHNRKSVIEGLRRVSKPSCRVYCGSQDVPKVRNGMGISILSTPNGVISGKAAKAGNVGGEILCYVW